eukprot:3579575-Rhodomonas_salina.2
MCGTEVACGPSTPLRNQLQENAFLVAYNPSGTEGGELWEADGSMCRSVSYQAAHERRGVQGARKGACTERAGSSERVGGAQLIPPLPEIQDKQPNFQYSLYQEGGFFCVSLLRSCSTSCIRFRSAAHCLKSNTRTRISAPQSVPGMRVLAFDSAVWCTSTRAPIR